MGPQQSLSKQPGWRGDFTDLSGIFAPLTVLDVDFRHYDAWPSLSDYNQWAYMRALTVRFVPAPRQKRRRRREGVIVKPIPYEVRVLEHGEVPTRTEHWHDFFNALIWTLYPSAKIAVTRTLAAARPDAGALDPTRGIVRSREQDRLACFDEGGVVLVNFGDQVVPYVFGHAMYEAILLDRLDTRALTLQASIELKDGDAAARLAAVDAWLAGAIAGDRVFSPEVMWPSTPLKELLGTAREAYGPLA